MLPSRNTLKYVSYVVIGLAAILVICLAIANHRARARLDAKLTELLARSEPVSIAELARAKIPPKVNAATFLRRTQSDAIAIDVDISAAYERFKFDGEGQPGPTVLAAMQSVFDTYPNVMPLLAQAAESPEYDARIDLTRPSEEIFEQAVLLRNAARVLDYHARVAIGSGQPDVSIQDCIHLLKLTRHFDNNPLLSNILISFAVRGVAIHMAQQTLRGASLTAETHRALEAELANHDLNRAYRKALLSDRAYGLDSFGDMADLRHGFGWVPSFANDQLSYIELVDAILDASEGTYSDSSARGQFDSFAQRGGLVSQSVLPSLVASLDAKRRVQAQLRCLRILNAAIAAETAGTGEPTLASLNLPADATTDPYNGQPLHLKKTPLGWVVYSVGRKLTDDGGFNIGYQPDQNMGLAPSVPAAKQSPVESAAEPTPAPGS